jgi:Tol biopolymer transport system component
VANDTNHASDVFLRDLQTGTTILVSTNGAGPGSANGSSYSPTLGLDGRYVTYLSTARNILALPAIAGTNLFVYDRTLRTNYALTTNGVFSAASTPDGRYVVFGIQIPSGFPTLYEWDSQSAQRVFTNGLATGVISSLAISTNGQTLAYILTSGTSATLKIVDRAARVTSTVSAGPFGPRVNPRFSGDGQTFVYATTASNSSLDTNKSSDVYVFDLTSKTNALVSRSFFTGIAPNGNSDLPDISSDGRYITYQSDAPDIVPSDNNNRLKNVFLYDRQSSETMLLSASAYGIGRGDYVSQLPAFTGDGQTVAFQSWASDMTTNDFNQGSDLFLFKILGSSGSTNPPPVFTGQILFRPGSGSGQALPQLTWAAASGVTYQVQFKTNLADGAWLPVNGGVVIQGGQGYVQDLAPDPDHRFYRIVASQ